MPKYHDQCLICEGNQLYALNAYARHDLVKCANCGFIFIKRIASPEELENHYKVYNYSSRKKISPVTIQRYHELLDGFEKYRKHNRILDVGCGTGWFLEVAKERGWEVFGTEFSEAAVSLCQEYGLNVVQGALHEELFEKQSFDVITSFEVIEHIDNPLQDVQIISSLLRKGGLFYCTTPNFNGLLRYIYKADYSIINYPEHLSYYTPKTFDFLMNKHGLVKQKLFTTGISVSRMKRSKKQAVVAKPVKLKESVKEEAVEAATYNHKFSEDEKLRLQIESKKHLQLAKQLANAFFKASGTGLTIKAYYEKL
jgi:SAM-dependent methyltransferase